MTEHLPTQPTITLQGVFNRVYAHLVKQAQPALTPGGDCMYRTQAEDGTPLMCAVGCLITDEFYTEGMEGKSVADPIVVSAVFKSLGVTYDNQEHNPLVTMLVAMQAAHDAWDGDQDYLAERMRNVAIDYGLAFPEFDDVPV